MNLKENSAGWGAYQNKKKEIETLKKQLIVQDTNKFGDVITLNKNNIFRNVKTNVNPFRFPNKIKTEELEQNEIDDSKDNDEIANYKKKLLEYNTYITENDTIIEYIQKEYDEKVNKLKTEYENKLLEQKNKYEKWKMVVFGLTELINDFNNNNNNNNNIEVSVCSKNESDNEEIINDINENQENIVLNIDETNKLTELKITDNYLIQHEIIVPNDSNKKKGRKMSSVSEKRLKEGDTEKSCLVEIDDVMYEISYKYCTESYMCYGGQIFMSNSSIVKHKGNIIDVTFNGKRFSFYINNKLIQINYKRPTSPGIKNVFNSNTIIRHKVVNEEHTWYERNEKGNQFGGKSGNVDVTFDEYCIYIKSKNKFFRCDINGNYNDKDEYKTLSPFIIDNYSKYIPYYNNKCQNQFEHLEYFCKKEKCFKSFNEIWHDSKIN
jgi:hypothetical protein